MLLQVYVLSLLRIFAAPSLDCNQEREDNSEFERRRQKEGEIENTVVLGFTENFLFCFHAILLSNFAFHSHIVDFLCATNKNVNLLFLEGEGKEGEEIFQFLHKQIDGKQRFKNPQNVRTHIGYDLDSSSTVFKFYTYHRRKQYMWITGRTRVPRVSSS